MAGWNQPTAVLKSLFTPCLLNEFKCDPTEPFPYTCPSTSRRRSNFLRVRTILLALLGRYPTEIPTRPRSNVRLFAHSLRYYPLPPESSTFLLPSPPLPTSAHHRRLSRSRCGLHSRTHPAAKSVCGPSVQKTTAKFSYHGRRPSTYSKRRRPRARFSSGEGEVRVQYTPTWIVSYYVIYIADMCPARTTTTRTWK